MFVSLLASSVVLTAAHAADIPPASYQLKLDPYELKLRDYPLASGLRIIFQEEHSNPIVAVTSVVDHGSDSDFKGMEGMAHVIEHLAFRAKHGDLPKNMDLIKQLGGSFNAFTADDVTAYQTVAPRDALMALLKIEALRLTQPIEGVTQLELDLERDICRNELRMRYENAVGDAYATLYAQLFPADHPYHSLGIGTHQTLDAITLDAVHQFTEKFYRPEDTTIVVVGDFNLDDAGRYVQEAFGEFLRAPGADPAAPVELITPKARIPEPRPLPPPPTILGPTTVQGMVDKTTVVAGWTLPAGYHLEDSGSTMLAVNLLQSAIIQTLNPDWDPGMSDEDISWGGCGIQQSQLATMAYCFFEPRSGMSPEKTLEKIGDSLYEVYDPSWMEDETYRQVFNWSIGNARADSMASILRSVDLVSSLSGRATETALYTHFAASPAFFSDSFRAMSLVDIHMAQDIARTYLTRERMTTVIVEPLSDEEKARRSASTATGDGTTAAYHGAQAADEFEFAFDVQAITPEALAKSVVTPPRAKIKELTLENGLRVVILPHGDAPLAHVGLWLNGRDRLVDPLGIDALAEDLADRGAYQASEDIGQVAGSYDEIPMGSGYLLRATGSSGNPDALLRKVRLEADLSTLDWAMADKRLLLQDRKSAVGTASDKAEWWADRLRDERTFPGTVYGKTLDRRDYEAMNDWSQADLEAWMRRKYQPKNAILVVVGKMDQVAMEGLVHKYFDSWTAADAGELPPAGYPLPTGRPERQVLLFDDDRTTQSSITLSCQLPNWSQDNIEVHELMAEAASEEIWRKLREQGAVTYGAYAYSESQAGGLAALHQYALVQNNAVAFAVETMFGINDFLSKGEVDAAKFTAQKWALARTFGLSFQSGDQMMRFLATYASKQGLGLDWFDRYAQKLAAVTPQDFPAQMETCMGHEVITIVGPLAPAKAQLDEVGIPYQVVDWKALNDEQYTAKELAKKAKAKAKADAEKAKKEAAKTGGDLR